MMSCNVPKQCVLVHSIFMSPFPTCLFSLSLFILSLSTWQCPGQSMTPSPPSTPPPPSAPPPTPNKPCKLHKILKWAHNYTPLWVFYKSRWRCIKIKCLLIYKGLSSPSSSPKVCVRVKNKKVMITIKAFNCPTGLSALLRNVSLFFLYSIFVRRKKSPPRTFTVCTTFLLTVFAYCLLMLLVNTTDSNLQTLCFVAIMFFA